MCGAFRSMRPRRDNGNRVCARSRRRKAPANRPKWSRRARAIAAQPLRQRLSASRLRARPPRCPGRSDPDRERPPRRSRLSPTPRLPPCTSRRHCRASSLRSLRSAGRDGGDFRQPPPQPAGQPHATFGHDRRRGAAAVRGRWRAVDAAQGVRSKVVSDDPRGAALISRRPSARAACSDAPLITQRRRIGKREGTPPCHVGVIHLPDEICPRGHRPVLPTTSRASAG